MPYVRVALPVPLPQLFDYTADDADITDVGRCVRVPFGNGCKNGLIVAVSEHTAFDPARLKPVQHIQRDVPPLPPDWLQLVEFTARYYHAPLGEVVSLALPPGLRRADSVAGETNPWLALSSAGNAALEEKRRQSRALRLLEEARQAGLPARRNTLRALPSGTAIGDALRRGWLGPVRQQKRHLTGDRPTLSAEQRAVLDALSATRTGFSASLLHGVTGSGKTEIYLRLAERVLAQGGQVLMLVPEIALTPQLEARVADRFPFANVVCLHSAMSEGARSRGFVQTLTGAADIVMGTRLAVFAPLPKIGLILVDEEHDTSYKQQEGVRYNARDIAVWRANQRGIPIVLGSATPSLESWNHASANRYTLLRLRERAVASSSLPTVRHIDTRRLRLDEGLSPDLQQAIGLRLERGEQSLVFLNRRGYAPVLACPACGWTSTCPNCSANLVLHLADRRMRCHHCGMETSVPRACPDCGEQDIRPLGRGTQRVEARLVEMFPHARVLRLDRDAVRTRNHWESLLATIARGEADILVGTQLMTKGHDFPRLTLVGVIGADASLHAADFRAPERLFQQLMQVGGRAGRDALPGEVLIQTEYPSHPLYRFLARQDFDGFARTLLDERRRSNFPPCSFQAMLRADAPALDDATVFLHRAKTLGEALDCDAIRFFDPVPMRLTRLARRERAQLLIESPQRTALHAFLSGWIDSLRAQKTPRDLRWQIDIDPLEV